MYSKHRLKKNCLRHRIQSQTMTYSNMTTLSTHRRSIPPSTTTTTAVISAGMMSQLIHAYDGISRGCAKPVRRFTHVGSSVVIYINSIWAFSGKRRIKNCTNFPLYNLQTFSKTSLCRSKVSSPKKGSSQKRDVTITLDRTRHQARPFPLVISRLVIESGGSSK